MCSWVPKRMHTYPRPAKPSTGRGLCLPHMDWAPKRERTILHSWHCSPLMSAHSETGQRGCKEALPSEFWWGSPSPVLKLWITQSAEGKKHVIFRVFKMIAKICFIWYTFQPWAFHSEIWALSGNFFRATLLIPDNYPKRDSEPNAKVPTIPVQSFKKAHAWDRSLPSLWLTPHLSTLAV